MIPPKTHDSEDGAGIVLRLIRNLVNRYGVERGILMLDADSGNAVGRQKKMVITVTQTTATVLQKGPSRRGTLKNRADGNISGSRRRSSRRSIGIVTEITERMLQEPIRALKASRGVSG